MNMTSNNNIKIYYINKNLDIKTCSHIQKNHYRRKTDNKWQKMKIKNLNTVKKYEKNTYGAEVKRKPEHLSR